MGNVNEVLEGRYSRQILLPRIGVEGQERLGQTSVLVLGCGALGSVMAEILVLAGLGLVRIVDRDVVEPSNLQRQALFDEEDARLCMPKAEAAQRRLRLYNSHVRIEGIVADMNPGNVARFLDGISLVLDGTDNVETRYVLNDACLRSGIPWVYGGSVGTAGIAMTVMPGLGPCLRCIFPDPPAPGSLPTCDTVGVLGTAPHLVASLQATEAIKLALGDHSGAGRLISFDVWTATFTAIDVKRQESCVACGRGRYEFLDRDALSWVTSLCGRNAVQISPPRDSSLDLSALAETLAEVGQVAFNGLVLTATLEGHDVVIFPDGRLLVRGTTDKTLARQLAARYLGY